MRSSQRLRVLANLAKHRDALLAWRLLPMVADGPVADQNARERALLLEALQDELLQDAGVDRQRRELRAPLLLRLVRVFVLVY